VRSPWRALRGARPETFWALKDVSLEVREGEALGLIGRNGSGKTTLLKLLSRITRPTEGWAEIRGRVRSLLEVGTGFHPELTGRENTYLSGSILGMRKGEIDRKFDEIVAFAEIDKFIDTPVKHYSSGMYVRLAFSVAAHLEPEILLVDEVLAVGDINFQKKCLGKMGEVTKGGRTVVLVSHQLNQIRRLCHRAIWVDGGKTRKSGPAHEVINLYESEMAREGRSATSPTGEHLNPGSSKGRFVSWEMDTSWGSNAHSVGTLDPVTVRFTIRITEPIVMGHYGIALRNHEERVMWAWAVQPLRLEVGEHQFCHTFPMLPLRPGLYKWVTTLYDEGELMDWWECTPEMAVATEMYQHPQDEWGGILNLPAEFTIKPSQQDGRHN